MHAIEATQDSRVVEAKELALVNMEAEFTIMEIDAMADVDNLACETVLKAVRDSWTSKSARQASVRSAQASEAHQLAVGAASTAIGINRPGLRAPLGSHVESSARQSSRL